MSQEMTTVWLIEPRDPLIARDGRPFSADPGARATSLPFPYPSTTTGGLRTRAGESPDGIFSAAPSEVKEIPAHGPLLVELNVDGTIAEWLAPPPQDALLLQIKNNTKNVRRKRLVPVKLPLNALVPLPHGVPYVVGQETPEDEDEKATAGPTFWHWKVYENWLRNPASDKTDESIALAALGHDGPTLESRMHVAINDETSTYLEGGLFGTRGLEFTRSTIDGELKRMALAVVSAHDDLRLGAGRLGGERRLIGWSKATAKVPVCGWLDQIVRDKHCRLVLLTPAHFVAGWRPDWLDREIDGVTIVMQGACVGRAATVSGWDFETKRPKPTRRLAPAGSVYFLKLDGTEQAIAAWVRRTWFRPVSDDSAASRDGFGMAALGVWDGTVKEGAL